MKTSGVGGQAVIEGVMMKNRSEYAIAVRKPDGDIEVAKDVYLGLNDKFAIFRLPFFRGIASFIDSLSLGMKTLSYSSSFYDEEDKDKEDKDKEDGEGKKKIISKDSAEDEFDIEFVGDSDDGGPVKKLVVREWRDPDEEADDKNARRSRAGRTIVKEGIDYSKGSEGKKESIAMALTVVLSFVLAIGIFVVLPFVLSELLGNNIKSYGVRSLIEGCIRLVLFILYIKSITMIPDIKRVFMYHGAEHKVINCIENGHKLNVANARNMTKAHKRCGTSFLLYVVLISIVLFVFIQVDQVWLRMLLRIVLVPVIAGIAYEFIRLAGRSDNVVVNILSTPGLWLQGLTTKEPDDEMLEVAIASVEAVFDWEKYQEEGRRYDFRRNRIKNADIEADEDNSTSVEEKKEVKRRSRRYKEPDNIKDNSSDNDADVRPAGKNAEEDGTENLFEEETDDILAALDRYFVMEDDREDDDKP